MDADTIEARSPKGKASLIYAKHKFSFGCAEFKEPKRVRWLALELKGGKKQTRKCQRLGNHPSGHYSTMREEPQVKTIRSLKV